MFVIKLMTSPKGEGQGPFRMGPHRPPPYTPSSLHPTSDSCRGQTEDCLCQSSLLDLTAIHPGPKSIISNLVS